MEMNTRIFDAGHTWLIGSAVVRRLRREGYRQITEVLRSQLDLQDSVGVARFFEKTRPEFVVLAAGRIGGVVENQTHPANFMDENVAIQLNVLKTARRVDVAKLILFGSSCMYPRECPQPVAEDALLSGKPEPTCWPYAISKLAGTYIRQLVGSPIMRSSDTFPFLELRK